MMTQVMESGRKVRINSKILDRVESICHRRGLTFRQIAATPRSVLLEVFGPLEQRNALHRDLAGDPDVSFPMD
jgi:hypothetical protein